MKRSGIKRKPTRNASAIEFSAKTKWLADERAGNICEAGSPWCTRVIRTHHHRLMRAQGGMGTLENCLACCTACHNFIHGHPKIAYENGWLIRRGGSSAS